MFCCNESGEHKRLVPPECFFQGRGLNACVQTLAPVQLQPELDHHIWKLIAETLTDTRSGHRLRRALAPAQSLLSSRWVAPGVHNFAEKLFDRLNRLKENAIMPVRTGHTGGIVLKKRPVNELDSTLWTSLAR